jgi:ankyrin repeat protein
MRTKVQFRMLVITLLSSCLASAKPPAVFAADATCTETTTQTTDEGLFEATRARDPERAKACLNEGAKVNAKDRAGDTALNLAAWKNSVDVAKLLIAAKADVNAKDPVGRTPLHQAALMNSVGVAKLLIEAKADVNAATAVDGDSISETRNITPRTLGRF